MKNRKRQRELRKQKYEREALLKMRTEFGVKDLTPYNAVLLMKKKNTAEIALR